MNQNEIILSALRAAIGAGASNLTELTTAMEAVRIGSPIAGVRVRRALKSAIASGDGSTMSDADLELCRSVIASVDDRGGILPDADGKLSHIHLRVESGRKSAYVRAARSAGESLSEWIVRQCDAAAE